MILRIIYIRQILLTASLLISFNNITLSQGTDLGSGEQQKFYIGLNLGPSQTLIENEGVMNIKDLSSGKKNSFSGSLEAGYYFSRNFGVSSGIGFNSYKTELTLDPYQNNYNTTDTENDQYNRRVSGEDIIENQKITFLDIPFCANIKFSLNDKFDFFLQPGLNVSIPVSNKYSSNGTFTFTGYYPAYDVILQDLPAYFFATNAKSSSDGELELKSFNIAFLVNAGFSYFIQEKIQVAIGVGYDKLLSSISNYSTPENFQLSSDVNQINSMMEGSSNVSAKSIGVKISLRYYLK